jgi:hypothetical protein
LAAIVAIFKEPIQAFFFKPGFKVEIETRSPYCVKNTSTVFGMVVPKGERLVLWQGTIFYARLWVQNTGRTRAEGVEVFVTKVEQELLDGSYNAWDGFIPANLRWAHTNPEAPETRISMSPEMGRHCDLGAIANPECKTLKALPGVQKGQATFDLALEYPLPEDAQRLAPGRYRITLKVGAANTKPIERRVIVRIDGTWTEDVEEMFRKHLGVAMGD